MVEADFPLGKTNQKHHPELGSDRDMEGARSSIHSLLLSLPLPTQVHESAACMARENV